MSYFLRNVLRDSVELDAVGGLSPCSKTPSSSSPRGRRRRDSHDLANYPGDLGKLLRHCVRLPHRGNILYLPTTDHTEKDIDQPRACLPVRLESLVSLVAAPSSFGLHAIARAIVLKYASYLESREEESPIEHASDKDVDRGVSRPVTKEPYAYDEQPTSSLASTSIECMLSVLYQLSRRDSELCVQALQALLASLQILNTDPNESPTLLRNTHETLLKLREEGSPEVSSKAASCLAALSVSSFFPEFIFSTAANFLCQTPTEARSPSDNSITIPENLHRLALFVQHRAFSAAGQPCDWWTYSLAEHLVLCSFDLTSIPNDSSPETPDDDRRLNSAVASDGAYVYVLNHLGLYKLGTGFAETIGGKIYASNAMLKSSRNCILAFCNGSLYLRRGQSSRVWVLDQDSLRERGEIMLQPGPGNSTIFSDGSAFYQAHIDAHSTFIITKLNDSFLPVADTKVKQKLRLTKLAYSLFGDVRPVPHNLLHALPSSLHGQVSDLHLSKEIALLLARSGKVYYAGNGARLGLQETGSSWMELVLPETIVQITVGTESVLFRSGSGHVWIAGAEEKKKSGKLRRLHTIGRKKTCSIAASSTCFVYVTENGKVYANGKHAWRTHPETGMIMGLEGTVIATVALGKAHAVAVSRHGQLYTWGVNNLGQCGRMETPSAGSSPRHAASARQALCLPSEHLWIRDVASLCVLCGKCSSRGAACPKLLQAAPGGLCPCGPGETACLRCGICRSCGEAALVADDSFPDQHGESSPATPHRLVLGPARVHLQKTSSVDIKVASVSCGNFHTILLAADRQVFTFGSNGHGQLGVGDTARHVGPQKVVLPAGVQAVQVAAGANHCVIRASDGSVYTFGAHKAGQLGREDTEEGWHCKPGMVDGFGPTSSTLAGWVGASGDTTIIHAHTTLLAEDAIGDAQIVANKSTIFIFPRQIGKEYVVVRRKQNTFTQHQLGPAGLYTSYCLEPTYNVLWTYSAAEMRIGALTEAPLIADTEGRREPSAQEYLRFLRCPELMVPVEAESMLSHKQLAISLLSSTYALTLLSALPAETRKELSTMYRSVASNPCQESRSVMARFESNGGGWGYSAHSVDAIQFKTSADIRLLGIGLYGGRGEYNAKVKMFRLQGFDGDEMYVEELASTDEVLYECPPRDVAPILFVRPILIRANVWHVVSVKISGPSSDCGSNGHASVDCEGVVFTFRNSSLSNNGTDVTVGQIPELYYQMMTKSSDDTDERSPEDNIIELKTFTDLLHVHRSSLVRPAPAVFSSLLQMLQLSSNVVFKQAPLTEESLWERERAALVVILTLRILRFYMETLYPPDGSGEESAEMADCIIDMLQAIHDIFQAAREAETEHHDSSSSIVVEECIASLIACSHITLSSPTFVLSQLAIRMSSPRQEWPLTALLYSISNMDEILVLFPDVGASRNQPPTYPNLTEKLLKTVPPMSEKARSLTSLQNVMSFLFDIAFGRGNTEHVTTSMYSLENVARDLIKTIAKELVKGDVTHSDAPPILNSPCRFRRRTPTASWDMSTGAADAVCVRVDRMGVKLAGVGVYVTGIDHTATFTIEVLRSDTEAGTEEKWETVERASHVVNVEESRDTASLKFLRPVPLEPAYCYAIRVASVEGVRSFAGENGSNSVRLVGGARLIFSNCVLSENGTCLARGQIPFLLYSVKESSKNVPKSDGEKTAKCFFTLLRLMTAKVSEAIASATMTSSARDLVSAISGYAMVLMEASPQRALEVVTIIDQLLPIVSSVNGVAKPEDAESPCNSNTTESGSRRVVQTFVESAHPYSPSCIQSIVCGFDKEVELMFVDMEECCRTSSADDVLWLYVGVERECYVPVARYSGSMMWKQRQLMLPGNSLWFILESGAPVEGASDDDLYGFRCSVHGYSGLGKDSNLRVEQELAWLSASACRLLVQLPSGGEELTALCIAEEETRDLLEKHGSLLRKGLNIGHIPTLHELHTRNIPAPALTPELKFIREFVSASPTSVAGALSRWLPTGPIIDPSNSQLILPSEEFTVGCPATIKLITRDQFGRLAQSSALSVEVTIRRGNETSTTLNHMNPEAWCPPDSLPPLTLFHQNPYMPVYMNKARYMSIGMMPIYANWSYEELRMAQMAEGTHKDIVAMSQRSASAHCGTWFPRLAGKFHVECRIDGFTVPHSYEVEVVDRGIERSERKTSTRLAQLSRARLATIPAFAAYAGLRIRSSPSLISGVTGTIPRGSTVSYIEELENSDGRWLRLTEETSALHAQSHFPNQAWCLQYHRALDKVLIDIGNGMQNEEAEVRKSVEVIEDRPEKKSNEQSVLIEANEMYILTEGEKVQLYSEPSLSTQSASEYLEGRREIQTDGWIHNTHGVWVRVAGSHKYILAEDAVGRSSVHSQLTSVNGNEDEEEAPPLRTQLKPRGCEHRALRPSIVDCSRTVFAAFLWHEHLVKDAMAAATYLKCHSTLQHLWSSHAEALSLPSVPPPLQPFVKLWKDVCAAVHTSIDQHLIMPSPPAVSCQLRSQSSRSTPQKSSGELCELCDERYRPSITGHMRMAHPGCGGSSQGYGYNSSGKYTTGWTGACGDGGRSGATWFLLCPPCRQKYLRLTPAGHNQERKKRWREFRLSSAALDSRPETVMKQNALFLLDLNSSVDGSDSKNSSTNTSGWTINLFPTAALTPSPIIRSMIGVNPSFQRDFREKLASSTQPRRDSDASILRVGPAAHASDPGPRETTEDRLRETNPDVLQSPSNALKSLVSLSSSTSAPSAMLRRPVMAFVIEHHDLTRVREASSSSIRRAVAFAHAFRVWNWLLRLVSSETSVSDVLLQYVWSLSSYLALSPFSLASPVRLLPHPWRLCFLAGPLSTWMVQQMHSFLYTVAIILQSNTVDSRLRSLCFKAWTIQLSAHEQDLLILTCNILASVGGVLSEPSTDGLSLCLAESDGAGLPAQEQNLTEQDRAVDVKSMGDVTSACRLEASSRQAMLVCLTDGSPDTFWESGDEDKSRCRVITVRCENTTAVLLCVHIDNVKDEAYRTSSMSVRATQSDGGRKNIFEQTVDQQFVGWIKCCIAGLSAVQIILKGPAPNQRVRQLSVFGLLPSNPPSPSRIQISPSHHLLFSPPQRDAFALFQAISSQAFSDELSEEQHTSLRQRVLDLLFSRVHLQPLQTYVCSQIVSALEREVAMLRERAKRNYSYACGLMAMLVRVVGSRKGTEIFAARDQLLITLSELLLFAPQVVQCQTIETMEKLFGVFHPSQVDVVALVTNLLVAIAKVLSLQVRDRHTKAVSTVTFASSCGNSSSPHWRLDKPITPEVGRLTMQLIQDVTSDRFSSDWCTALRKELASVLWSIVHLSTDVSVESSASVTSMAPAADPLQMALRTRRFWLAVSALSVLQDKSWLELVDGWRNVQAAREDEIEVGCDNHDDGRTAAQVHCDVCNLNLCRDCFRILHLNKRNRAHEAHLIGGASSAPHVDIHEGCSRLRLHNILVLLHSSALTGMVEQTLDGLFPSASSMSLTGGRHSASFQVHSNSRCRFCSAILPSDRQLLGVCSDEECVGLQAIACDKTHGCGHACGGVKGEVECLPCLKCPLHENRQDGDDVCVICLIDRLGAAPSIMLECGHIFHYNCVKNVLERRWNGPRILFRFMNCPLCNHEIAHPSLAPILEPIIDLKKDVETKAKMRLEYDGLLNCQALTNPESEYFGRPSEYAMDRYVYVQCFKCNKAYFGGESRCQLPLDSSQHNPQELLCGGCSDVKGVQMCGRHGVEFLEFKCRFCCSIAVYFCFGTTHFCAACHDDFQRLMTLPRQLLPPCPVGPRATALEAGPCPLRMEHAPTGEEFAMGCGVCRNLQTF